MQFTHSENNISIYLCCLGVPPVSQLFSSLSCSSLTPLSTLLFSSVCLWFGALQMFDSQSLCFCQVLSGPPAVSGLRLRPLHVAWPAAVWVCMWTLVFPSHSWTAVLVVSCQQISSGSAVIATVFLLLVLWIHKFKIAVSCGKLISHSAN